MSDDIMNEFLDKPGTSINITKADALPDTKGYTVHVDFPKSELELFLESGINPVGKRYADKIKWRPDPIAIEGTKQESTTFTGKNRGVKVQRNLMWPVVAGGDYWWRYLIDSKYQCETIEVFEFQLNRLMEGKDLIM